MAAIPTAEMAAAPEAAAVSAASSGVPAAPAAAVPAASAAVPAAPAVCMCRDRENGERERADERQNLRLAPHAHGPSTSAQG
jgi:hypothetical protein